MAIYTLTYGNIYTYIWQYIHSFSCLFIVALETRGDIMNQFEG